MQVCEPLIILADSHNNTPHIHAAIATKPVLSFNIPCYYHNYSPEVYDSPDIDLEFLDFNFLLQSVVNYTQSASGGRAAHANKRVSASVNFKSYTKFISN